MIQEKLISIAGCFQKEKDDLPVKIIQFGGGNFIRGFVDWMVQQLNKEANFNAGVVIVQPLRKGQNFMFQNKNKKDDFKEQNYNFTLCLQGIKNGQPTRENEIIYCVKDTVNPYTQFGAYLKYAHYPTLKFIVSNTTEAGITFDSNDQYFETTPLTFPGKLTLFLYERFKAFSGTKDAGLYILPCELVEENGKKLEEAILQYVELWELGIIFKNWLKEANVFYNTLVDRIVPGYPKDRIDQITQELGYEDNFVVDGEQFHLFAIEGPQHIQQEFPAEKANLNVIFTNDLSPYHLRKVRILNGAHTTIVPIAYLAGFDTVREAVEDEQIGEFMNDVIFEEIIPSLASKQDDIKKFALDTIDRFKNPYIKHYLMSISLNSFSKFESRVLPSILAYYKVHNKWPNRLMFAFASLLVFYRAKRGNDTIKLNDDDRIIHLMQQLWDQVERQEITTEELVTAVLADQQNWKMNLNGKDGLKVTLVKHLESILDIGICQNLKILNKGKNID